jgi:chromosome condensin MukBEF MukE localization factor
MEKEISYKAKKDKLLKEIVNLQNKSPTARTRKMIENMRSELRRLEKLLVSIKSRIYAQRIKMTKDVFIEADVVSMPY